MYAEFLNCRRTRQYPVGTEQGGGTEKFHSRDGREEDIRPFIFLTGHWISPTGLLLQLLPLWLGSTFPVLIWLLLPEPPNRNRNLNRDIAQNGCKIRNKKINNFTFEIGIISSTLEPCPLGYLAAMEEDKSFKDRGPFSRFPNPTQRRRTVSSHHITCTLVPADTSYGHSAPAAGTAHPLSSQASAGIDRSTRRVNTELHSYGLWTGSKMLCFSYHTSCIL